MVNSFIEWDEKGSYNKYSVEFKENEEYLLTIYYVHGLPENILYNKKENNFINYEGYKKLKKDVPKKKDQEYWKNYFVNTIDKLLGKKDNFKTQDIDELKGLINELETVVGKLK